MDDLATEATDDAPDPMSSGMRLDRRFELIEVLVLAVAAVMTAWAAFQSTKWGGVQADSYSRAGAARVESTRASTRAGQLTAIDVDSFIAWVTALSAEERAGEETGLAEEGAYEPNADTESGFLYERFRDEFRTAVDSWLATRPLANPTAAPTPFAIDDYQLADNELAAELEAEAEAFAATARAANQDGDNYVFMAILFAMVLFFTGVASKMDTFRARALLLGAAVVVLLAATAATLSFPIEV